MSPRDRAIFESLQGSFTSSPEDLTRSFARNMDDRGFAIVPKEPTFAMKAAMDRADVNDHYENYADMYKAALAAAQQPKGTA